MNRKITVILILFLINSFSIQANEPPENISDTEIICLDLNQNLLKELVPAMSEKFKIDIAMTEKAYSIDDLTVDLQGDYYSSLKISDYLDAMITVLNEEHEKDLAWYSDGKKILIAVNGENIDKSFENRFKPNKGFQLLKSVRHDDISKVKKLLDEGASPNFPGFDTWTPVTEASGAGRAGILELLISRGGNVNVKQKYTHLTPLHVAVLSGQIETAKILLENGAEQDTEDTNKKTPLDLALENKQTSIIQLLENYRNPMKHK